MRKILLLCFNLFAVFISIAQPSKKAEQWTIKDPFEFKVFIENKGQFILNDAAAETDSYLKEGKIAFGARQYGVDIYFTGTGIIYRHTEVKPYSEKEREEKEEREHGKNTTRKEKEEAEATDFFLNMEWLGSNPDAEVYGVDETSNYFTYSDLSDVNGKSTLRARAFKKIIYKNIYPDIDLEFIFPEDKGGIKYTLILHPGADASLIKMKYRGANELTLDAEGNIKIASTFGEFIDHAPMVYSGNGKEIPSSFELTDNTVSFNVTIENNNTLAVIDPWLTIPVLINADNAFDIDYDYSGNTYIYGGRHVYELLKYDSLGVIQWTYQSSIGTANYGDFCVDRNSGFSYICEGGNLSNGSKMLKFNSSGNEVASYAGNLNINEMWNIVFNSCTGQGIIGCGNTDSSYQAATFDTNLTVIPVNIALTSYSYVDVISVAIDETDAYFLIADNQTTWNDNTLIKCPLPTLTPTEYIVPTTTDFKEIYSIQYNTVFSFYTRGSNSYNGMAKGPDYIFIYDGSVITKLNPLNGNFIDSVFVDTMQFLCGGIAVDACNNIFVGTQYGVKQYDQNLNYINEINTPGIVYDLKINEENEVIACGNGFVSALNLFTACANSLSATVTATPSSCNNNDGTASIVISGGSPPYNYLWTPGGQTTSTATGLAPGDYFVKVWSDLLSCSSAIITSVNVPGFRNAGISGTPVVCFNDSNGTAQINATGGAEPYFYLWSPTGQITETATGLTEGMYTVIATDSEGCQVQDSIYITSPTNSLSANYYTENICNGQPGRVGIQFSTIDGGVAPYTGTWSTGYTGYSINNVTTPGSFTATITDANGCSVSYEMSVTEIPRWYISSIDITTDCHGPEATGAINIHLTADSLFNFNFQWDDDFHTFSYTDDSILTDLNSSVYECRITDSEHCIDTTISIQVPQYPFFYDNPIEQNPTCGLNNGYITSNPTGGIPPYTYLWENGQTTQTMYGLGPGEYAGTVTDSVGCNFLTGGILDTIPYTLNIVITQTGDTLYASQALNYQWYYNDTLIPGASSQNYLLTGSGYYYVVTTEGSCTDTSNIIETTCLCVGISENELAKGIFIYPNPTNNKVTIEMQKAKGVYELYDANGKLLLKGTIKKTKFTIDLSIYSTGVYFIRIIDNDQVANRKIIIE
ncbi:MAG: T9SS type A sorting domain-containing protein [Bacteroidia bacterium]